MIAYIKGTILLREPGRVLINTGNLGYNVYVDQRTELNMSAIGQEQELYTYQLVRETELTLYGFDTLLKLECFELLLTANKIGPRLALSVLSVLSPEDCLSAILVGEIKNFGKIPGVGKKLLSQVILDCKTKTERLAEKYGLQINREQVSEEEDEQIEVNSHDSVVMALQQLGFTSSEIRRSLANLKKQKGVETMSDENKVSLCLRFFRS